MYFSILKIGKKVEKLVAIDLKSIKIYVSELDS
jgi:hypothetical protein